MGRRLGRSGARTCPLGATIAGEPFFPEHAALRIVQIVVLTYAVVVFAALAGTVGAFLLERRDDDDRRLRAEAAHSQI